ncbi:MAG: peptide-methionine (R)-S-oxide reductase [Flavobacteriales bacterium]|nr:peptide-methionine (R)-S-oxide reductase [Flavobacteriales bacterium]
MTNLSESEKSILVDSGTESPFSGKYNKFFDKGTYVCKACEAQLFESNFKFDSHCGWPSFDDAIKGSVIKRRDTSLGRIRTEIICVQCEGHLGHVFEGENYTEKNTRYCVNSLSLKFIPTL